MHICHQELIVMFAVLSNTEFVIYYIYYILGKIKKVKD